MNFSLSLLSRAVVWVTLAVLFTAGCGSAPSANNDPAQAHMKVLGLLYGLYQSDFGAPPASQEKFVAFLQKSPENWNKIAPTAEQFLASAREGAPLVVIYGNAAKATAAGDPWIAYEANAVDGQQLIVNAFGHVHLVDEQEFSQFVPKS
jgi:hypothetical protein